MEFLSHLTVLSLLNASIALSIVLSLRFLHFPDLTIDGTVATGGGVFAVVLLGTGSNALAVSTALLAGFCCGLLTMFLHERLKIGQLLSGILVFTALYSINMRIMGGSNISILKSTSFLDSIDQLENGWLGHSLSLMDPVKAIILFVIMVGIVILLRGFYHSRPGTIIRAIGDNERAVSRLAIPTGVYKYVGLGLANMVAALAGVFLVANQGFADVSMGMGSLVAGLAALIVGEKLVNQFWHERDLVLGLLLSAMLGTVIYQGVWLAALSLGLAATDMKLFTALFVAFSFVWGRKNRPFYSGRVF